MLATSPYSFILADVDKFAAREYSCRYSVSLNLKTERGSLIVVETKKRLMPLPKSITQSLFDINLAKNHASSLSYASTNQFLEGGKDYTSMSRL